MDHEKRPDTPPGTAPGRIGGRYSRYLLGVLVPVYGDEFPERPILPVLNGGITPARHRIDDRTGLLYGTALAVFHPLFEPLLGRLAGVRSRCQATPVRHAGKPRDEA